MFKRLILVCIVLALSASAQFYPSNSRIASLAETFIIDDINDVLRYAAYMKNYEDDLQVTFTSPIIGIKAVGDKLRLGAIGNRGLMLSQQFTQNFYSIAIPFVNGEIPATPDISIRNQYIPHALLGVDAGILTLGFDVFFEYARSRYNQKDSLQETSASASIHNPGVLASALFGEDFQIAAKLGLAVPRISGKAESNNSTVEVESDKGIFLEFGGEAGIPVGSLKLSMGVDLILEKYAFEASRETPPAPKVTATTDEFTDTRTAIYAGVQGDVFTNGLWAAQYTLNLFRHTSEDEDNDAKACSSQVVHSFSVGLENGWDNLWIFDKVYARGGMKMDLRTSHYNDEVGRSETRTKDQTKFDELMPTLGLGIQKGVFTLDLNIDLGGWSNLVTGPRVSKVTAGLFF
jgi:hypothetical protein